VNECLKDGVWGTWVDVHLLVDVLVLNTVDSLS